MYVDAQQTSFESSIQCFLSQYSSKLSQGERYGQHPIVYGAIPSVNAVISGRKLGAVIRL